MQLNGEYLRMQDVLFDENVTTVGVASQWNLTNIQKKLEDIKIDAHFAWLLFSLLIALVWFTYITHYSARVFGQILTRLLNHFIIKDGYLRIGSLTWDALSGKIMFRDIIYITEDFSLRIQDGWLVFRWWRMYVPKDITEDLSHSDTRLSLLLNGFELHVFNRSQLYSELERLFGLDSLIIPEDDDQGSGYSSPTKLSGKVASSSSKSSDDESTNILGRAWRDLIPVIKTEISSGRVVFGNRLVPATLVLSLEEGHMVYSTKPAASKLDHFLHMVTCKAENFKVTLAPSLKYTGLNDEPPRLMGEGFVVLSSNTIEFYFYMDEPGLVPEVPVMIELTSGDVVECQPPVWGLDIRCGKGTDFSYGPWADRMREQLYKFFYPQDYQPLKATPPPRPGERRAVQSFDIRFSTLAEATVDILFSKVKETNAVHMTIGAGSYLEITIPWTTKLDGYSTKISGQLLHVDASTSLQYRSLLEAETLEISVLMQYPIQWNAHQSWSVALTGNKATLHLIYEHRYFFQDLINDWSSRTPGDLLSFVPYTWFLKLCLKEFELITVANQYNWVDCASHNQENTYAAFSGDFFELGFDLPFVDFLPPTIDLNFRIKGEALDMNVRLPEMSTSRAILLALAEHAKIAHPFVEGVQQISDYDKTHWRNFVKRSEGWVQCWRVPYLKLDILYIYHPMPLPGPAPQANVPTPEREELLLTPVRFPAPASSSLKVPKATRDSQPEFDVTTLAPDQVTVDLELGPSQLFVYGTVLRVFLHLKENIFGEDQRMADMDPKATLDDIAARNESSLNRSSDLIPDTFIAVEEDAIDVRVGRPLHVDVSVVVHDIQAHLMKHCNKDDPPCPTVFIEKLNYEMNKTFQETRLQLVLSPAILYSSDVLLRPLESRHLQQGFLVLSALQVRGHAMFSAAGRAIDQETIEYAWMVEAILGQLTGRLTLPQLQHVISGLEAFLHLALDDENQMTRSPKNQTQCHHGTLQPLCPYSTIRTQAVDPFIPTNLGALCPSAEDIKYRLTRLSVDLVDLTLVETGTAFGIQIHSIRLATCNLHSNQTHTGVSLLIPSVNLRQYLATSRGPTIESSFTALNVVKSGPVKISSSNSTWNRTQPSCQSRSSVDDFYFGTDKLPHQGSPTTSHRIDEEAALGTGFTCQEWLEVGVIDLGPVYVDVASSMDHCRVDMPSLQGAFLRYHDIKTRRLWFVWETHADLLEASLLSDSALKKVKCGCRGGCAFFGRNSHGQTFFKRSEEETDRFPTLANPQLKRGTDPAFAQSILREDHFLIDYFEPAELDSLLRTPSRTLASDRPLSEVSNTSTVKNIEIGNLAHSEGVLSSDNVPITNEEEAEDESSPLIPPRRPHLSSRISLQETRDTQLQRTSTRGASLTSSSPSLLSGTNGSRRHLPGQTSLPVLVDATDSRTPSPLPKRKQSTVSSKASKSESQSELYYSAEDYDDGSSSSEEMVSFPSSPPDTLVNTDTPKAPTIPLRRPPSTLSSSTSSIDTSSTLSTSSRSSRTSNISFNSAVSTADDFSLVDLHLQSARPVVDSPLLLTSYITHLSEADSPTWSQSAPRFPEDIRRSTIWRPRFVLVKSGFSSFRLVDRPPVSTPGNVGQGGSFFPHQSAELNGKKNSQPWSFDVLEEEKQAPGTGGRSEGSTDDATTVIVKVGRPIHVMCSPLSLESAQRFAEALIPTLEHLHPLSIMTRVYGRCMSHVDSQNPLKKKKMTLLEQKDIRQLLYRDPISFQLRGSVQIPRINLCFLQAGIVEQIISVSMLDNPRDLVCVSSVAVCIDSLSLHFSQSLRQCRMVQAVSRPVEQQQSGGNKSFFASVRAKARPGKAPNVPEIVFVEWSETESEQLMASGTLGKIHLQLRRLNNDTTGAPQPENVTATVIPSGCSRVLFNYSTNEPNIPSLQPPLSDEEKFGSVMFECGLQGLNLRAVKRVSNPNYYAGGRNQDKMGSVTTTIDLDTSPAPADTSADTVDGSTLIAGSVPSQSSHASFKKDNDREQPMQNSSSSIRPQEKDLSSCSLQIQAVWLSFAAPPRSTPPKKTDMALLDRNLLSTASPAINAWMNSGDRLTITVIQLMRVAETRSLSVLAGLMAEALDVQHVHVPIKSKYSCLSLMSRTLQEDPSCQLNLVLHRYALTLQSEWTTLEARLAPTVVPPLSTLKQGVVVLSRQWKNAIYTPYMLTYSMHRTAAQKGSAVGIVTELGRGNRDGVKLSAASKFGIRGDISEDDEQLLLLGGGNEVENSWISSDESSLVLSPSELNESTLPLLSGMGVTSHPSSPTKKSALRRGLASGRNVHGLGGSYELKTISASSIDEEDEDDVSVPLRKNEKRESKEEPKEDLYNWLARQQKRIEPNKSAQVETERTQKQVEPESSVQQLPPQLQQFNLLVDTRAIFVSLFASVGLDNTRSLTEVLSLSGSASVLGGIEELRVEIYESEWSQNTGTSRRSKANKSGSSSNVGGTRPKNSHPNLKFSVYIPPEVPAFLCERMAIEIQVNQVPDGGSLGTRNTCCNEGLSNQPASSGAAGPTTNADSNDSGGEGAQGTASAGFLGHFGLLKPQRTTALNFSVSVGYIAQQVNMPLLRLLHQLSGVYGNAKATQVQLREQRPLKRGPDPLRALSVIYDSNEPTPSPPLHQQPPISGPEPSPSILSDPFQFARSSFRPSSFLASRLRAGSRFVKSDDTLEDRLITPQATDKGRPEVVRSDAAAVVNELPTCWRTIYQLLDLYASMTAATTVNKEHNISDVANDVELGLPKSEDQKKTFTAVLRAAQSERTRIVVFGIMRISRVRLLAMLSGLRLESEIVSLHTSLTYKEKVRSHGNQLLPNRNVHFNSHHMPKMECSLTGHLGRAMIVLLEGVAPSQQTVVKITVGKSQALYSRLSHHGKDKNSGLVSIGPVHVDIPQHPGVLHGMMTRGSKQLSSTLQEFRVPRMASRNTGRNTSTIPDEMDVTGANTTGSNGNPNGNVSMNTTGPIPGQTVQSPPKEATPEQEYRATIRNPEKETVTNLPQPLVMQFTVMLQRLSVTAALLPSLQAQYQMEQVVSSGVTGSKAKFDIDLPRHSLSFTTKLQITENLPPSASIELPQVHVGAEYLQDSAKTEEFVDGVVLCRGNYLSALAEIGVFEHCLTTDLLNHLVFVQKVFMAEVNDVLNKVSGSDKPVPLWEDSPSDHSHDSSMRMLLYNLIVQLKGIQITATTPTNTAVRLETGLVELQLSNRVQNVFSQNNRTPGTTSFPSASTSPRSSRPAKLFGRAKVDLNLSLGQLIRNVIFEEAEAEFQQVAFFKTRITLRNAFQDELTPSEPSPSGVDQSGDKEVVLITLTRPLIYLQPAAVDKAILVWLNYKNAYDYWAEQRGSWITDASLMADKLDKLGQLTSQFGTPSLGTLFLQLTVDDMGICMPLNTNPAYGCGGSGSARQGHSSEETCSALVITLENSSISACSSCSLVSKGKFTGLCLRFADDFETGLDDWKPQMDDPAIMNLCVVSEGTYEVCSRTVTPNQPTENAKWILHVGWQMEGVDTHFDTSIGKQFSALGHTLTSLTGGEEEEDSVDDEDDDDAAGQEDANNAGVATTGVSEEKAESHGTCPSSEEDEDPEAIDIGVEPVELRRRRVRSERAVTISETVYGTTPRAVNRRRSRLEKEMSEQARIIQDLRSLGASSATVEQEMRRLQELEALASKDFRREMLQRLRRQSARTSSVVTDHTVTSASSVSNLGQHTNRPSTLHHTQSQRLPHHVHSHHQRSRSVVVSPAALVDVSERNSSDDALARDTQRLNLPTIEGSPPMSSLSTPTAESQRMARRAKSPTPSVAVLSGGCTQNEQVNQLAADNPTVNTSSSKNSSEPSVDLELDFKVFINSGKCVLHTRDSRSDESGRRMKKERSLSSTLLDSASQTSGPHQPSPAPNRKPGTRSELRQNASTARLRAMPANSAQMAVDLTIFHIPGLDVKVYYESKTIHEEVLATNVPAPTASASPTPISGSSISKGKVSSKKGSLFAWMTLHSIPEETIISPHILEFLEQALEPIPITIQEPKPTSTAADNAGLFGFDTTNATSVATTTASFPVDVVVYCHVQPSTFRFSCLPVSRVECLLRLPSLHLVFSSKRSDLPNQEFHSDPTNRNSGGGLSVTGCLSDFSLYIFHPYGGGKKTSGASARRDGHDSDSERKDSLSVNVEFVKFNLSRSRKVTLCPRSNEKDPSRNNGRDSAGDPAKAVVRFSTLIDIGSASFKYDMRRLPEILAFPKAWYRRTIVRHLFLGDLSKSDPVGPDLLPPSGRDLWAELQPARSDLSPTSAWETLVVFAVNFTRLNVHMNMGNVMGNVSWLTKDFNAEGRLSIGSTGHKNMHIGIGLEGSGLDAKGGIVGGTIELSGIHTSLAIKEDPGTEPNHIMEISLQVLECRLDYMGTSVLMGRVSQLKVELKDQWNVSSLIKSPDKNGPTRRTSVVTSPTKRVASIFIHGDLGWDQLQLLISRSTTADLIKMYLKLDEFFQQQFRSSRRLFSTLSATPGGHSIRRKGAKAAAPKPTINEPPDPGFIATHHRHWQSVLKRVAGLEVATLPTPLPSTGTLLAGTMDLHGSHISLACFHGLNFKSKSWALFSLKEPCVSFTTEAQEISGEGDPKDIHVVQSLSFSLGIPTPSAHSSGVVFREQQQQQNSPASMATVCRISRTQVFPPQFKTIQDWFLYAFANSRLDAMEKFPSLERDRASSAIQGYPPVKTPEYNHTAEVIFAFPSLQLHLKTDHWQSGHVPLLTEEKPKVDCSFITDFEDHIFVTVDAEAFFFLHDLISSYVREKERVISSSATSNIRTQSPELPRGAANASAGPTSPQMTPDTPNASLLTSSGVGTPLSLPSSDEDKKRRIVEQIDWRDFECKTWHLEPTVRLLSWAGKRIEPYGVDYILHKLGFSHARITIPKWVQRGAMDPLDKILAIVLSNMIAAQRSKDAQSTTNSTGRTH